MNTSEAAKYLLRIESGGSAVIEKLIAEKLLRTSETGDIRAADLDSLRRNNALLVRISSIRREVAADETAKQEKQAKYKARREFLIAQIEEARADGNHAEALRLFDRLDQLENVFEVTTNGQ
jgi:hypothetical protein